MKTELAFFDVDGTLSVPVYCIHGKECIGVPTEEEWVQYCQQQGEDSYRLCRPVPRVRDYAEQLKQEGAKLYVLTSVKSAMETAAKQKFVRQHYSDLFEEVLSVSQDAEKLEVIQMMAQEKQIAIQACELVEDRYETLLLALSYDIKTTHISALFAEEEI